jgi:hypothetical protein
MFFRRCFEITSRSFARAEVCEDLFWKNKVISNVYAFQWLSGDSNVISNHRHCQATAAELIILMIECCEHASRNRFPFIRESRADVFLECSTSGGVKIMSH